MELINKYKYQLNIPTMTLYSKYVSTERQGLSDIQGFACELLMEMTLTGRQNWQSLYCGGD